MKENNHGGKEIEGMNTGYVQGGMFKDKDMFENKRWDTEIKVIILCIHDPTLEDCRYGLNKIKQTILSKKSTPATLLRGWGRIIAILNSSLSWLSTSGGNNMTNCSLKHISDTFL